MILLMKQSIIIILRLLRTAIACSYTCIEDRVKMRFRILQRQLKTLLLYVPNREKILRTNL